MKICKDMLSAYIKYLEDEEKSQATIGKYTHDLKVFMSFIGEREPEKGVMIRYKEYLTKRYSVSSVNSMLAAVNGFLDFLGLAERKLKPLKLQRAVFMDENKELKYEEFKRLSHAAKSKDERTFMVMQTICATGIRISELKYITVESLKKGKCEIFNKGKYRTVFLSKKLQKLLLVYAAKRKIKKGAVFITKSGRLLNRSNIWRAMKSLCEKTGVEREKVFPHNLRHLFARKYYERFKDISRLADILGHSRLSTTRS